ncbi:MAG: hypothetical protein ACKOQS_11115 [Dolichospermum sp.]
MSKLIVRENLVIYTALSGVMRYTTGGQDAHPTRVLLLKFVPHSNGICCKMW